MDEKIVITKLADQESVAVFNNRQAARILKVGGVVGEGDVVVPSNLLHADFIGRHVVNGGEFTKGLYKSSLTGFEYTLKALGFLAAIGVPISIYLKLF